MNEFGAMLSEAPDGLLIVAVPVILIVLWILAEITERVKTRLYPCERCAEFPITTPKEAGWCKECWKEILEREIAILKELKEEHAP